MKDHVYMEFSQGGTNKFWEATLDGRKFKVHWGKIGTKGQSQTRTFRTEEEALRKFETMARSKVRKGYVEIVEESEADDEEEEEADDPDPELADVGTDADAETSEGAPELAPPSPPTKPSPEVSPIPEDVITWTPETLCMAGPVRGHLHTEIPIMSSTHALEARVPEKRNKIRYKGFGPKDIARGIVPAREWLDRLRGELVGDEIVAAHVLSYAQESATVLAWDLATNPTNEALERFVRSLEFGYSSDNAYDPQGYTIDSKITIADPLEIRARQNAYQTTDVCLWTHRLHGLVVARQALATASQEVYDAIFEQSQELYARTSFFPAKCFIAALFPGDEERFTQLVQSPELEDWAYVSCWTILALATLEKESVEMCLAHERFQAHLARPVFWSLLYHFGEESGALLAALIPSQLESARDQAAVIRAPSVVDYWIRCVETNEGDFKHAIEALSQTPILALIGASTSHYRGSVAAAIAARLIMEHPDNALLATANADERADAIWLSQFEERAPVVSEGALPVALTDTAFDPKKSKASRLPTWFVSRALPPIKTKDGDVYLSDDATARLLVMMSTLDTKNTGNPHPGFEQVREYFSASSLEAFSLAACMLWLELDGSSKRSWALHVLGEFGGDSAVRVLEPKIRRWPGESAAKRAQWGLDVLARIGTDVALMNIYNIAHKMRYKSLKKHAEGLISQLAEAMQLSEEQLGDRLVPDFGLDARGRLALDYGPRSFEVSLDEHLQPIVYDSSGKTLARMPKPGAKDDAELAKEAHGLFKGFKKDLKSVARQQLERIERAMVTRRRWGADDFLLFLVEHPLMLNLTRRLLWGIYDGENLRALFRVDLDHSVLDQEDEPIAIEGKQVGIVHGSELSEDDVNGWVQVFADYEIIQPFEQLTRVFLTREAALSILENEIIGATLDAPALVFGLEKLGWKRGPAIDNGIFERHELTTSNGTFLSIWYDGFVAMGVIEKGEPVTITGFQVGSQPDYGTPPGDEALAVVLEDVSDIELSELVLGLRTLLES